MLAHFGSLRQGSAGVGGGRLRHYTPTWSTANKKYFLYWGGGMEGYRHVYILARNAANLAMVPSKYFCGAPLDVS